MEIKGLGAQPCGEGWGQYFALLSASGSASAITSERDASTVWHAYSLGPPLIAQPLVSPIEGIRPGDSLR